MLLCSSRSSREVGAESQPPGQMLEQHYACRVLETKEVNSTWKQSSCHKKTTLMQSMERRLQGCPLGSRQRVFSEQESEKCRFQKVCRAKEEQVGSSRDARVVAVTLEKCSWKREPTSKHEAPTPERAVISQHVHTAIFKVDNQQGPTAEQSKLCSVFCT